MRLAYVISPGRGDADRLLARFAAQAAAEGARVCGLVQTDPERTDAHPCDMDVRVLPDGPVLRISQALGAGARGCRLDPGALERAVADTERRFAEGCDLLIVNKFGKREAEGRGFRPLIAEAVCAGIPVLCGLNGLNRDAFLAFAGGEAAPLAPALDALAAWRRGAARAPEAA